MRLVLITLALAVTTGKKTLDEEKPDWAKKDVRDWKDADLERLLDQWDEDEEAIPPDELPDGHPDKPQPQLDLSKLDMRNPDQLMMASKKGKTVMMFATILDFVDKEDSEEISSLWQTGLYNNHIQSERLMIEDDKVMFMFRDGAWAWEAKDYLLEQERVDEVQLEQNTYYGRFSKNKPKEEKKEKHEPLYFPTKKVKKEKKIEKEGKKKEKRDKKLEKNENKDKKNKERELKKEEMKNEKKVKKEEKKKEKKDEEIKVQEANKEKKMKEKEAKKEKKMIDKKAKKEEKIIEKDAKKEDKMKEKEINKEEKIKEKKSKKEEKIKEKEAETKEKRKEKNQKDEGTTIKEEL